MDSDKEYRFKKKVKMVLLVVTCLAGIHGAMFCYRFEIISDPVISRERGWVGPYIRGDKHTTDAGKVGFYESSDYAKYDFYTVPCYVWIRINGLKYHGV